jgi:AraC-like DNA-binding protein
LEIAQKIGLSTIEIKKFLNATQFIRRSSLLDFLLKEYFYERILQKRDLQSLQLLENNIFLEIFNLGIRAIDDRRPFVANEFYNTDSRFLKSLKFIESNLFVYLTIEIITKTIGISQASLFRDFKKQLNSSPLCYIRNRRLEEAKRLLEIGNTSVGDVAILIGYNNFGAFCEAFKTKYHKTPSHFLKKVPFRS